MIAHPPLRPRLRLAAFAAAVVLSVPWGMTGCGSAPAGPGVIDERKTRVMEFWRLYHEASAARTRGDLAAAASSYQAALRIDPDHEDSLYHLGQCLQEAGQASGALAAFRHLVEVNDSSARGHLALGSLLASVEDDGPWDLEGAERHLRRAHEINGEETGPMLRLGEVRLVRGDAGEAERWLNAAAATNPKSVEAALLSGFLRWKAGDRRSADEWFAKALKASRADAPVKGVLNEGDRKAPAPPAPASAPASPAGEAAATPARLAAPPLAAPMGRTLFDDLCRRIASLEAGALYAEAGQRAERLSRRTPRAL